VDECRQLAVQASAALGALRDLPRSEQGGAAAGVLGLLRRADGALQSLELASRQEAPAARADLAADVAALRAGLREAAAELERARRELLLGAEAGGDTARLFLGRGDRRRAGAATDALRKGHSRLGRANAQALETEEVGVLTLQRLRGQREQILAMEDRTKDLKNNLTEVEISLQELEKACCWKWW
ncbi:unnamed protein product, partial [Prorocentrum cordatum]